MKSDLIAKRHWKWATNALNAANRDAVSRDPQNAVSRAYYAMMHAANAALAVKGLQAKTHKGTQTLFNEHLVQPGKVTNSAGETSPAVSDNAPARTTTYRETSQKARRTSSAQRQPRS